MATRRGSAVALLAGLTAAATPAYAAPEQPVRVAAMGDWGASTTAQRLIAERICATNRSARFAALLTTGDNFYSPDGTATPANFDRPSACIISAGIRWRASWGNHDLSGNSTATRLGARSRWYRFQVGAATVVVLDSNDPTNARQLAFMRAALKRTAPGPLIVAFHAPLYGAGYHRPSRRQRDAWEPMFRRARVDLVLQGHNHNYDRSLVRGITYVTTGGGGNRLYPCLFPAPTMARCAAEYHFLDLSITRNEVRVAAVRPDGSVLDRVTVPASAGP
ncbi:MAG: metallophosphoesterase [Actinobacteria bacterium]|nr:metallophosphoesterase [Actinomycetota bacterium]